MKYLLFAMAICAPIHSIAEEFTYYSRLPEFMNHKAVECEQYVREQSNTITNDFTELLAAHNDQDWNKSELILSKYGATGESELLLNNKYIKATGRCGGYYVFNGERNIYDELHSNSMLFLLTANFYSKKKTQCAEELEPLYKSTIKNIKELLLSKKTANKSFKTD